MMFFGAVIDTPRFYAWGLLSAAIYTGAFTIYGAKTGVYWARGGPVERRQGRRFVTYMVLSTALTLFALGASLFAFVEA